MIRWKELSLVALATGCLDPVVGGRCEDGWVIQGGRCAPDDAGARDARGSAVTPVVVPDGGDDADAGDASGAVTDGAADGDAATDAATDNAPPTDDAAVPADATATDATATDATATDATATDATTATDVFDATAPADVPPADAPVAPEDASDVPATMDAAGDDVATASDDGAATADVGDPPGDVVVPPEDVASEDAATPETGVEVDAGQLVCEAPSVRCGDACVDTLADALNCGGCGVLCATGEFCFSGTCAPQCPTPFTPCGASCIDLTSDADNCGGCGVQCATGVCNGGRCRESRLGHLALIGHDYAVGRAAQNTVVGNAVFMASSPAPRVLAVNTWTPPTTVNNTINAIQQVAGGVRRWSLQTVSDYAALSGALTVDTTDVLLVYAQNLASDAEIGVAARIMAPAISSFVRAGGVAVVLDGEGANAGTWQVAAATGLISIDGRTVATGETLTVENGTDALGVGLPFEYRGERSTVAYFGTLGGIVVSAPGGAVVVHRGYLPRR